MGSTSVLDGDTDAENNSLSAVLVSGPAHATSFTLHADGSFTYVHDGSETTSDSFTYKVNDGTDDSSVATVTITVTPVNDAPVANPDATSTRQDTPLSFAADDLTVNDTDVEQESLVVTAVTATPNTHGTVTLSGGNVTYTPATGFTGSASFTYTISDGHGGSATGTVNITVNAVTQGTPGKITGGGSIDSGVRNFGFEVQTKVKNGAMTFTGNLEFQDKSEGYNLHSTAITQIQVAADGVHASFTGTATLNGVSGFTFFVEVEDWGEPGARSDKFHIRIVGPNDFSYDSNLLATSGGVLDKGGNIQVHKK